MLVQFFFKAKLINAYAITEKQMP